MRGFDSCISVDAHSLRFNVEMVFIPFRLLMVQAIYGLLYVMIFMGLTVIKDTE